MPGPLRFIGGATRGEVPPPVQGDVRPAPWQDQAMRTNTVMHARSIIRDKTTWAAYGLLTVYTFFLSLIGPLLPHLRAELGLGYAAGALHTSAFAAGVIV